MDKEIIISILEKYIQITDEWGGTKIADWKWSYNLCLEGLDECADAIMNLQQQDSVDQKILACQYIKEFCALCPHSTKECDR